MTSTYIDNSVKEALDQIIKSEGFEPETEIHVNQGSEVGDGYSSKTYAVTVKGQRRTINLFIKYYPIKNGHVPPVIEQAFHNENIFYKVIYPALLKFQEERGVKDGFRNVPKSYSIGETSGINPIVLQNVKLIGYNLRNRQQEIDDDHIMLALETFAKLHAVSYAMKDQEPVLFEDMVSNVKDCLTCGMVQGFAKVIEGCINLFIERLDSKCEQKVLDNIDGLCENLIDFCMNTNGCFDKYSVLTQGDCWSNNAMYLYKENERKPLDIKLIDWQLIRVNSPVLDISYFFYTVATKEMMNNLEKYQKVYYVALLVAAKTLGSDVALLYPYTVFKEQWKKYSKFGFALAFLIIKGMLYDMDEVPDMSDKLGELEEDMFNKPIKNQDEYQKRIKDILEHFVDNNLL